MFRLLSIIVVLIVVRLCAPGQSQTQYRFEHLSLEEGVAANLAYAMLQDRAGFLWFGTMYGLVRYDGSTLVTYRYDPDDPNSLSNDDIVALLEDRAENLWIGTFGGGLNKIDRATGAMVRFTHDPADPASITDGIVWSICEDHTGVIWLGTNGGGLEKLDPATGTFTHFRNDSTNENSLSEDAVFSVIEDAEHVIWIGTKSGGIDLLDSSRTTFSRLRHDPADPSSLGSNEIRKLYADRDGGIWVCTYGGGLNRFVRSGRTFVRYQHDPSNDASLSLNFVNAVIRDRSGICWVATPYGLNRLEPSTGAVTRIFTDPSDEHSVSSNNIAALMEDGSGVIWIGSYQGGVDKLIPGERRFRHIRRRPEISSDLSSNNVQAIAGDHAGVLWVGTEKGLNASADSGKTFRHFTWDPKDNRTLSGNVVTAIAEDANGVLWVGTRRALNRLGPERTSFVNFRSDPDNPQSLAGDAITALAVSRVRPDELWVGSASGLTRVNTRTMRFNRYRHDRNDSSGINHDYILSLYEDREGFLWIGTYAGLNRLDPPTGTFTRYEQDPRRPASLSNNYCLTMTQDSAGALWIGTGGGLNRLERGGSSFEHFGMKEGLPNAVICGIIEETPGIFWISTYKGLSRFDSRARSASNFDISDGLQSNMFTPGAVCGSRTGYIYFGGINGINALRAGFAPQNTFVPNVAITSFTLLADAEHNLMRVLPGRGSVTLSHEDNSFVISFAALDYTAPAKNQYAYQLEGYDEDWSAPGNARVARYMNLSPGEYRFKVRGSNNAGVWNQSISQFSVIITPPFWRTAWFYSLSVIAIVISVIQVHRYRVRQKMRLLTRIERARNAESILVRKRAADDFHDEFGHKLTKISLLSQVIRRALNGSAPDHENQLDKIIETSNELSMGMRDFLWTLNPDRDSLLDVVIRLKDFGDDLFNSAGVGFGVTGLTPNIEALQLPVDWRRHITLLFKEAMHNAARHSGCSAVTLEVSEEGGRILIRLRDDGRGFDPSRKSDGQGLTSMSNRADKIHGRLEIQSQPGAGTTVEFTALSAATPRGKASARE